MAASVVSSFLSSARAAAPLADLVVIAAPELHPVGDQILRALEIGRPSGAGHEAVRLPHHVELAVAAHLADIDRLGDVVIGQHLGGTAGEVGHMTIVADGRICGCGSRGCLEAYASRTAITKAIMSEIHHGRTSVLTTDAEKQLKEGEVVIRSGIIASAIQEKDDLTIEVVKDAANYLGYGLASVINFYNPDAIVLGGGVIEAVDLLFETAIHRARVTALAVPAKKTPILRSKLGDFSGVVGAACLAAQAAGYRFPASGGKS